jgi:hypothetical protein
LKRLIPIDFSFSSSSCFRNLDYYPKTPERPPKRFNQQSLSFPRLRHSTSRSRRPMKPKLPTPPDSPDQSMSLKRTSSLSFKQLVYPKKEPWPKSPAFREAKTNSENCLPLPPACATISYLSDDSGRGTCTTSDLSDDCGHCTCKGTCTTSDLSDDCGRCTPSSDHCGHCRVKRWRRQDCDKQKPVIVDELFEREKLRNKIDVLKAVKCIILHKLSGNDDKIVGIIINLGEFVTYQEIEKVHCYVVDVEKITLLLSSLTRRLARSELRMRMASLADAEALSIKIEKIEEQLEDAKIIDNLLKDKCKMILQKLEKYLGVRTKYYFLNLINNKTKLLITSKEIDEKISLYADQMKLSIYEIKKQEKDDYASVNFNSSLCFIEELVWAKYMR